MIELVLTLSIIGIIAAIAAPRYLGAAEHFRADSAARRLCADITALRSRARSLCASQSMTFTTGAAGGTYTVIGMSEPDHPSTTYRVDLTAEPYRAAITAARFGPASGPTPTTLTINGYGVPAVGGTVTIAVGASVRTVVIDGDSGELKIQ